eukprot:CCRYP_010652-RA/>CCRYP_010652-RA protein AED:0.13 eAED:0.13 QI:2135/0.8/0.83/1/0.4/0.33/6/2025/347
MIVFCFPFFAIKLFNVTNRSLRMGLCFTPLLLTFRCLEAMFGTAPPAVEASLQNYCLYYSSIIELEFSAKNKKPVKSTSKEVVGLFKEFMSLGVKLGIIYSIVERYGYAPFGKSQSMFELRHIANNFFVAYALKKIANESLHSLPSKDITQMNLHMGTSGAALVVTLLFGMKTKVVTQNAMLRSTSVSDFWGRRWNQLVHGALKRGVFKPLIIKNCSKAFAASITFMVSGMIHEYILFVLCCSDNYFQRKELSSNNLSCVNFLGLNLAFFAYNGVLIMLEYAFIGTILHRSILDLSLPTPLLTCLVIGTALPVAHWFTDAYVDCGIYDGLKVGCPVIELVNRKGSIL